MVTLYSFCLTPLERRRRGKFCSQSDPVKLDQDGAVGGTAAPPVFFGHWVIRHPDPEDIRVMLLDNLRRK